MAHLSFKSKERRPVERFPLHLALFFQMKYEKWQMIYDQCFLLLLLTPAPAAVADLRSLTLLLAFLSMTCPLGKKIFDCSVPKDFEITHWQECCIAGTYVNGRRLPLQGRGWGFESLRAYHHQDLRSQISDLNRLRRLNRLVANIADAAATDGWI